MSFSQALGDSSHVSNIRFVQNTERGTNGRCQDAVHRISGALKTKINLLCIQKFIPK